MLFGTTFTNQVSIAATRIKIKPLWVTLAISIPVFCFWAAAPKTTKSCRTRGDFRLYVCSLVPPQVLSGLKSALSGLKSALSGLKSDLSGLESAHSGLESALSDLKSAFSCSKLA